MKVFISWSGSLSRDVAVVLRDWLPLVIQAVRPYVSSEDIDPGARWGGDIAVQLDDTDFGILCVSRDNVTAPWLNFEAGALSKSVERSRVVPFLIDLGPSDIPRGPLAQFQAVQPTRADVLRLLRAMNDFCGAFPPERLGPTVDVWWPQLEERLQEVQQHTQSVEGVGPQRSTPDMLAELLELTRGLQRELQMTKDARPMSSPIPRASRLENEIVNGILQGARAENLTIYHLADGPTDLKVEKGGRPVYIEVCNNNASISVKTRRTIQRMRQKEIRDPLIMLVQGPVVQGAFPHEPNVRIVEWQSAYDNESLWTAIEELSQVQEY